MKKITFHQIHQLYFQLGMTAFGVLLATTTFSAPALPNINTNNVFNIADYGAFGDGLHDNTAAIQSAINAAAAASGGGTVEVPAPGVYLSGPLTLGSRVNLQIDTNATLEMLPMAQFTTYPGSTSYFIYGKNVTDDEISGGGTIDGQGAAWWSPLASARPYMVYFDGAHRVLIQDVTLQNPPKMHIVFKSSDGDITIRRIIINTPPSPNTDGIDLVGTNCLVEDCTNGFNAGDDNIAIGSSGAVSANILITNCDFGIGHGVSIGSNTSGGVSNLTVINCTFNGTTYGIRMKSDNYTSGGGGEGGIAQNLSYFNLGMTNIVEGAIVIYSYYKEYGTPTGITPSTAAGQTVGSLTIPIWRNITISNVTATVASGGIAGIIWGRIEAPVTNVFMSHVNITAPKTFDVYNAYGVQFADSQIALPAGNKTYTLYNADITVSNSAPGASPVTFDGQTSANSMALYRAPASLSASDAFGANPITLDASTLTDSSALTLLYSVVFNFTLSTNTTKIVATGSLSLNGTLNISAGDGFGPGAYTLFTYGTGFSGAPHLGSTPAGYNYSLTNPPGQIQLLVQAPAPPPPPSFGSISNTSNGLVMSGTGGTTNGAYYVLASTNVALPLIQWKPVATNRFDGSGHFIFTNTPDPNTPQTFYLLEVP